MVILGIVLVLAGAGLLVAEAHLPSFGLLGIAGLVSLVAGGAIAVDASGGGLALMLVVALVLALAGASVRILREYERAVVFRLGRLLGQKGPGIVLLIPGIDRMVRVDLRTVTFDVPPQDLITRDNVPAKVNAVTYFRVVDPVKSVIEVERYRAATSQIAQTTLRSVLGKAEPERERRAKVINAEGEFQASERLYDAAQIMSANPTSLQLRYLQTLLELGASQASTIVFPLPIDLLKPLVEATQLDGTERRPPPVHIGGDRGGGEGDAGGLEAGAGGRELAEHASDKGDM